MEIRFKNILKKTKAIENGLHPIAKTFEGALFSESGCYLALEGKEVTEPAVIPPVKASNSLCDVLFLGDTFDGTGEDLLQKMIQAMQLGPGAVKRVAFDENNDSKQKLENIILDTRPKVVVSLGAIVTNILLERKEKLSTIHGQLIDKEINNWNYLLMPIFHPEFLLINPNMKRTAWNDLQKIMEFLKKQS
jgi:hypothetical protein